MPSLRVFQSTHPVRGATGGADAVPQVREISIHAPREGCDRQVASGYRMVAISIHAPREGCDHSYGCTHVLNLLFQSTHPVRGATTSSADLTSGEQFQSTHPVRGATRLRFETPQIKAISIHAPREGCDDNIDADDAMLIIFQSTHPVRGATRGSKYFLPCLWISIHAPREGCDLLRNWLYWRHGYISIHAPREGCDLGGVRLSES